MGAAGFRIAALALACGACTSIAADERTFEGRSWQVVAINGRPTPRWQSFHIDFARGRFIARMGCNEAAGAYRIDGSRLVPGFAHHTEMACEAPMMTFEQWGFAVLHQPMRMTWKNSRRLTLSNAAGSIEIEPRR